VAAEGQPGAAPRDPGAGLSRQFARAGAPANAPHRAASSLIPPAEAVCPLRSARNSGFKGAGGVLLSGMTTCRINGVSGRTSPGGALVLRISVRVNKCAPGRAAVGAEAADALAVTPDCAAAGNGEKASTETAMNVAADPGSERRFMNALSEWIYPSEHRPVLSPRSVRWRTLDLPLCSIPGAAKSYCAGAEAGEANGLPFSTT
jgi:hypothetical protein